MLYLFLVGIPMQIVAALITLSGSVLYPWYSVAPRTWGLSPLDDQQLGGLLMWVPGNLYMFLAIGVLFLRVGEGESVGPDGGRRDVRVEELSLQAFGSVAPASTTAAAMVVSNPQRSGISEAPEGRRPQALHLAAPRTPRARTASAAASA